MRHHLLSSSITMAPSSLSISKSTFKRPNSSPNNANPNSPNCPQLLCKHSPSATLDVLILILVLFSVAFLISSYFSYIFQSLSLLLPPTLSLSAITAAAISLLRDFAAISCASFVLFFVLVVIGFEICCGCRSRKCGKSGCKGLKKAMEFDLQLQGEECLRSEAKEVKDIDELPWKGGNEANPDYECLRSELRKMAPPNGRAVLLFRAKCGCPVAKLEGWAAKRGRRHKKSIALNGGDHR